MRPIVKRDLPDAAFALPASALLLQAFGEYCSVSEQPLPSRHHVWHKRLAVEVEGAVDGSSWGNLILLSENSYLAHFGKKVDSLLYPDEALTFVLGEDSPFTYRLESVTVLLLGQEEQEVHRVQEDLVIVSGQTEEAANTIACFDLNSRFFNESDRTMRIPHDVYLSGFDRRVRQRTDAWRAAEVLGAAILASDEQVRVDREFIEALLDQGRRLAAATGYWSSIASCLAAQGVDPQIIRHILFTDPVPWYIGPGPHNPYPNTNPSSFP